MEKIMFIMYNKKIRKILPLKLNPVLFLENVSLNVPNVYKKTWRNQWHIWSMQMAGKALIKFMVSLLFIKVL